MRGRSPYLLAAIAVAVFGVWYAGTAAAVSAPATAEDAADFPNYYFGGERLRDGRPVYASLASEVRAEFNVEGYDTYPADPPPTVVLFSPLSLLPYRTAWFVWSGISIGLLVMSMWVVARRVGVPAPWAAALAAGSLLTTPARFLVTRNHMEALLLALGVVGWLALRRDRGSGAAAAFGLAGAIKLFPGVWLLGLVRRHRRAGLVGFGIAGLGLALGMLVLGSNNTEVFLTDVLERSRRWYGTLGNYSLVSFGTAVAAPWLGWSLSALGAVTLLPLYLREPLEADDLWTLGTVVALLLSPLSWINYLVLALPVLVIVGQRLDWSHLPARVAFVAAGAGLVGWGPVVLDSELLSVLVSFVPTYALVALFFLIKESAWSATAATPSPSSA